MKIVDVLYVPGKSSYFFDDQAAIKANAEKDGFIYQGFPLTEGFDAIRQSGEVISVLLQLENGQWAQGDCAAVQYSGAAGRDPLFSATRLIPFMEKHLTPQLIGHDVSCFRSSAKYFDTFNPNNQPMHTAIRYGLSQALLEATSLATNRLKMEVVADEYHLNSATEPIDLFGQCGEDRHLAVDRMILKEIDVLPHGLINNVKNLLGENGQYLIDYIDWLSNRILKLRSSDAYNPQIHIDVYGTIGSAFQHNVEKIARFITSLEKHAAPFDLYIEGPVDMGSKADQISVLRELKSTLSQLGSPVKVVADEWCNTLEDIKDFVEAKCCHMVQIKTPDLGSIHNSIEAVLFCKAKSIEAYQGGTCNETDISAKCCVHIALATCPDRLLVKPGMGFDEGMVVVSNEMQRAIAMSQAKRSSQTHV